MTKTPKPDRQIDALVYDLYAPPPPKSKSWNPPPLRLRRDKGESPNDT
jgi:hypothetical protein